MIRSLTSSSAGGADGLREDALALRWASMNIDTLYSSGLDVTVWKPSRNEMWRVPPASNMQMTARAVRTVTAYIMILAGGLVLIGMLSGAHIDDRRRSRAFVRWRQEPTAATEAAWLRERDRIAMLEGLLTLAGGCTLAAGLWLVVAARRRQ